MLHVIRKIIVRSAVYQQIGLNTSDTPWDILDTGKVISYNVNNRHGERIKEMMKESGSKKGRAKRKEARVRNDEAREGVLNRWNYNNFDPYGVDC